MSSIQCHRAAFVVNGSAELLVDSFGGPIGGQIEACDPDLSWENAPVSRRRHGSAKFSSLTAAHPIPTAHLLKAHFHWAAAARVASIRMLCMTPPDQHHRHPSSQQPAYVAMRAASDVKRKATVTESQPAEQEKRKATCSDPINCIKLLFSGGC